jgi:hypothetical protein
MSRLVTRVATDVSEERIAYIIRVTRIGDLGTLAVISNRSGLENFTTSTHLTIEELFEALFSVWCAPYQWQQANNSCRNYAELFCILHLKALARTKG